MIDQNLLEEVVADQVKWFQNKDSGIVRHIDYEKFLNTKQIVAITGIRRCGKSTVLAQLAKRLKKNFYFITFDDERLIDFVIQDANELMKVWKKQSAAQVIFLDEIQNIKHWERFVRRLFDEGYKVFITGSNSKLLSSELSTHLTGRHFKIELFPFSFAESLEHQGVDSHNKDSDTTASVQKHFDTYLFQGGFPEMVAHQDAEYVRRVYEDVLYKDLITRFRIRSVKAFRQLTHYLFTNCCQEISYNNLKNLLGFKNANTVSDYVSFLEEAYLVFELFQYDFSLKKQLIFNKKAYVIDNGMRNAISFGFSEDRGKLLENLVFLELKRRGNELYFWKGKRECDFLIQEKNKVVSAIQVCHRLTLNNRKRELEGVQEAMKNLNIKHGFIITLIQEEELKVPEGVIYIVPAWRWFCQ